MTDNEKVIEYLKKALKDAEEMDYTQCFLVLTDDSTAHASRTVLCDIRVLGQVDLLKQKVINDNIAIGIEDDTKNYEE